MWCVCINVGIVQTSSLVQIFFFIVWKKYTCILLNLITPSAWMPTRKKSSANDTQVWQMSPRTPITSIHQIIWCHHICYVCFHLSVMFTILPTKREKISNKNIWENSIYWNIQFCLNDQKRFSPIKVVNRGIKFTKFSIK